MQALPQLVVSSLLLGGIYVSLKGPEAEAAILTSVVTPSPDVASGQALKQLRGTEDAILSSYGVPLLDENDRPIMTPP